MSFCFSLYFGPVFLSYCVWVHVCFSLTVVWANVSVLLTVVLAIVSLSALVLSAFSCNFTLACFLKWKQTYFLNIQYKVQGHKDYILIHKEKEGVRQAGREREISSTVLASTGYSTLTNSTLFHTDTTSMLTHLK